MAGGYQLVQKANLVCDQRTYKVLDTSFHDVSDETGCAHHFSSDLGDFGGIWSHLKSPLQQHLGTCQGQVQRGR